MSVSNWRMHTMHIGVPLLDHHKVGYGRKNLSPLVWWPICVLLFFCLSRPGDAGATLIMIDPGTVGESFIQKTILFTELNGTVANGQEISLEFVFTDMKHLEFDFRSTDPSLILFASIGLRLNFDTVAIPPFLDPISSFLSDENRDPVLGPGVPSIFRSTGFSALSFKPQPSNKLNDGLVFRDVFFSFNLFTDPTLQVRSASLEFNMFANGELLVVPIPAAVWLFGSGLIGLVGVARRKKA